MVLVSADAFLAKVTELYEQSTGASKGSVAISCKSGASAYLLFACARLL